MFFISIAKLDGCAQKLLGFSKKSIYFKFLVSTLPTESRQQPRGQRQAAAAALFKRGVEVAHSQKNTHLMGFLWLKHTFLSDFWPNIHMRRGRTVSAISQRDAGCYTVTEKEVPLC